MSEAAEITQVLHAIGRSEEGAAEKLLPLVYAELRRLAAARMAHELGGQHFSQQLWCMRRGCGSSRMATGPGKTARIFSVLPPKRCAAF
jgi:hypothetical protein